MTQFVAILRYPSPIWWLADQLRQAIFILAPETSFALPPISSDLRQFGTLASPIPLKLASIWQRSPQEIGTALIEQLSSQSSPTAWLSPEFEIQPSGWLYIHFSGTELAKWLQTLLFTKPELHWIDRLPEALFAPMTLGISEDPILFKLQYAHARCCSLLRLAQQARMIDLIEPNSVAQIAPTKIPWHTTEGILRLQNPSEMKLLLALMEFPRTLAANRKYTLNIAANWTDTIIDWPIPAETLQTHAQFWGDLFLNFYRESRILGNIQTQEPELAQARTALIYMLRKILAFWLEKIILLEAPKEM